MRWTSAKMLAVETLQQPGRNKEKAREIGDGDDQLSAEDLLPADRDEPVGKPATDGLAHREGEIRDDGVSAGLLQRVMANLNQIGREPGDHQVEVVAITNMDEAHAEERRVRRSA